MIKLLAMGLLISGFLGIGALGTIMGDYELGMMYGDYEGMESGMCSRMNSDYMLGMHEECGEHMGKYCEDMIDEECLELQEDCENYMGEFCDHGFSDKDSEETGRLSIIM